MKFKTFPITLVALAAVTVLSGCSTHLKQRNAEDMKSIESVIEQRQALAKAAVVEAEARRIAAQEVMRPYVAGNSIPLSRDARMPEQLRTSVPVTAYFANGPVDLATALRQVSSAAGIVVTAAPDALLPAGAFLPKTGIAASPVSAPPTVTVRANGVPLWKLLDDLAAQVQASWRPTPTGAEFYRVQTKTFELMTIPQTAATTASLGRTGSQGAAFSSTSQTTFDSKANSQMDGLKSALDSLISTGGKFSISPENQTLVVTDTPQSLERVEAYVKQQNKAMSRRVRMIVEAIEVVSKEGSDFGIDWTLVYNTTTNALSGSSPSGLASQNAGNINLEQMIGPLAGSGVVVKALNEVGTVVNRRVFPFVTTSGRPITQALRSTFNYVDQVQTSTIASSSTQVTQAPTVSQKDETVGTLLTMVPTAKPDGTVFLSVSFDVTTADPLRPFTVGSGSSAVTVQQKTINGSGIIQEVPVRAGRTEIIGGVELLSANNTTRRLGEDVPIIAGGSNTASSSKSITVLLVTAVVEEGV